MIERLRPVAVRVTAPFVPVAKAVNLTPDMVSVLAFMFAMAAAAAFHRGGLWYLVGAILVFGNGWLDLLDGQLARDLSVDSPSGDLLDHVLDRYADILLIAGLASGIDRYALGFAAITGVLMTSYLGTQAQAVGLDRVYGGFLGRAVRLVLIGLAAALAPFVGPIGPLPLVGWLLVLFAVVGHVTAVQRFYYARRAL